MNVLSLFDGMSCGQLALQRADIKVKNYFLVSESEFREELLHQRVKKLLKQPRN